MPTYYDKISTEIKVISQCFVKPKYEVEESKQPYYLGPVDLALLSIDHVQQGLLFSTKPENVHLNFVEKLKDSLAISLVHYYPLAGRFETVEDESGKSVYVDCTKGPGAVLINATVNVTVSDILSSVDVHPIVQSFFDLGERSINNDGHTRPLLSIQVTELVDGVFIGFSMNHSLVDGTTQWNFISSLSEIFLQLSDNNGNDDIIPISRKPVFRPYFPDGCGPVLKMPNIDIDGSTNRVVLREQIFHFSSKSISKLKAKANEECGVNNISSFQALSAFMWIAITRARDLQPELETCFALFMNSRPRFNPPISNDYFGNFINRDQCKCKVGELLENGLGCAAMLIHQLLTSQDDNKVREFYKRMVDFVCEGPKDLGTDSPNLVFIGGCPRFDTYRPDFDLGKAGAVIWGYGNKEDGKVFANPGRKGGGSVDLEVCLQPEFMNALELDKEFMTFIIDEE